MSPPMNQPSNARARVLALLVLMACSGGQAAAQGAAPPRDIEVLLEVPPSNFVYRHGDRFVHGEAKPAGPGTTLAPVAPAGASLGAVLGVTILANLVVAAVEAGEVAELQQAAGPVGASVQDLDLHATTLEQLRGLLDRMYVNVAALLIDKAGVERGEWVAQIMAPGAPRLEAAELAGWWADQRYRRFVLQGLRGALLPLVEEIADPALRAERLRSHRHLSGVHFDESGRTTDRMLGHAINVQRKASSDCVLRAKPGELVYHFERTRAAQQIVGAAYCADERPTDWNPDTVPGMAWAHSTRSAPAAVVRRP